MKKYREKMNLQPVQVQAATRKKANLGYAALGLPSQYEDSDDDDDDEDSDEPAMTWAAAGSGATAATTPGIKTVEEEFKSYTFTKSHNIEVDADIIAFWEVSSSVT